ncbi:hypothetical protein PGIGA_G00209550 [Pangasianodon gigas]|uniref:Uncharacterized protein n=1 Tax=Pangasianodon gigas TaxID=30993 RepID=A0ACC5WFX8_PANGG|nr:hypothetical protein [Pangasianodon gigas]
MDVCLPTTVTTGQMVPHVVHVTDGPSVRATHQTRPTVPDGQVTLEQQVTHFEIMSMAPGSDPAYWNVWVRYTLLSAHSLSTGRLYESKWNVLSQWW